MRCFGVAFSFVAPVLGGVFLTSSELWELGSGSKAGLDYSKGNSCHVNRETEQKCHRGARVVVKRKDQGWAVRLCRCGACFLLGWLVRGGCSWVALMIWKLETGSGRINSSPSCSCGRCLRRLISNKSCFIFLGAPGEFLNGKEKDNACMMIE